MCVLSVVYDQYRPYVPQQWPYPNQGWKVQPLPGVAETVETPFSPEELRELIDSFRKAADAARVFDRLTGQPDCEDPEKAKLEERVAELERRLDELENSL